MSKNTSKSSINPGTPKNTLFNYFAKSPAFVERKKLAKTPSNEDENGEKENLTNEPEAVKKPRNLAKELKHADPDKEKDTGEPENKKSRKSENIDKSTTVEDNDEEISGSKKQAKRRWFAIQDSDSSEEEQSNNVFAGSDDEDADYKASSDEPDSEDEVDMESAENSSDEEEEAEAVTKKPKRSSKRKEKNSNRIEKNVNENHKKPKLEIDVDSKASVMEKLEKLTQFAAENNQGGASKDDDDDVKIKEEVKFYDEPVEWPHQKLEFLKPDKIKDKHGKRPDHPDYDPSTLYVPPKFLDTLSPGVRQWWVLKSDNFDCVLFFKVGKFYELYHMDADIGVRELGFTYMRGEFAHSGFPEVSFDKMATTLVDRGYKIARVEQTETPDMMAERCKKIKPTKFDRVVRREICQITNRGTQVFGSQCEITANHQPCYMLAIVEKNNGATSRYGVSFIDTSIGDFNVGEFSDDKNCSRLLTLLSHNMPVLVIYEKSNLSERTQNILQTMLGNVLKESVPSQNTNRFTAEKTLKHLADNYYVSTGKDNWPAVIHSMQDRNDPVGLTPLDDYKLALKAIGICIGYLRKCVLEEKVMPMARFNLYVPPDDVSGDVKPAIVSTTTTTPITPHYRHMVLDGTTLAHLHITGEERSLLAQLDHCCTKFGKRLLHSWICAPSCDCNVIRERQQAISELLEDMTLLQDMRALFNPLPDIERQLAQVHLFGSKLVAESHPDGRAILFEEKIYNKKKLRNFIALIEGFKSLQNAVPKLFKDSTSHLLRRLTQRPILAGQEMKEADVADGDVKCGGIFPDMKKELEFFEKSFDHEAATKTGVIAPEKGIDPDYDAAERKISKIQKRLQEYLKEQQDYFGCPLNYFGSDKKRFQIEVPEKRVNKVTSEYQLEGQRKGTNPVKRYTTAATREFLKEMQTAEEERNRVVRDLARRVFEKFASHYDTWKKCVDCIAYLDVLGSLAEYAFGLTRVCVPIVHPMSAKPYINIVEGYHPCMATDVYIPNGLQLNTNNQAALTLLSGPNMGGKSTFMRQIGLLIVMSQIGSHVPADHCEFTIVDRIFSRLGAQDDILTGQSTFMVEMNEASLIVKHASIHSFVLMDELGRGTATYDGTAIAAAIVKYLAEIGCRTMFSTHYKSLNDHFGIDDRIQLGHMACMVENEDAEDPTDETVTFLYKYTAGACPKSYGFNAAKLAGMPHGIIKRAYELSKEVEAIALRRKIASKLVALDDGEVEAEAGDDNAMDILKKLIFQLKACSV